MPPHFTQLTSNAIVIMHQLAPLLKILNLPNIQITGSRWPLVAREQQGVQEEVPEVDVCRRSEVPGGEGGDGGNENYVDGFTTVNTATFSAKNARIQTIQFSRILCNLADILFNIRYHIVRML
ncbi:hypothetical protein Cni_G29244 [Canna indica]|uniref:Uncharacterized protein n=1 Tax=Canna indica TaxID=4628 RepID=A0AAQ3L4T0_9LILI|nr:hypothetical protein Cni_G29244 [Canna indica]